MKAVSVLSVNGTCNKELITVDYTGQEKKDLMKEKTGLRLRLNEKEATRKR